MYRINKNMKTLKDWFDEYAVSHQNPTNKKIHYICVPLIFFSIIGLLMCIPSAIISNTLSLNSPLIENWAAVALGLILFFYIRLSVVMAIKIAVFAYLCLFANFYISQYANLLVLSLTVFAAAWIGQFYGHKIEGKKPSFINDLQFLLIGPAWVIDNLFKGKK